MNVIAYFESAHETEMKEYVLYPKVRSQKAHIIAPSLEGLGALCQHNYFIIVLFKYTSKGLQAILPFSQDIHQSDV